MRHYSAPQWIDFARQTQDEKLMILMQKHLDADGCTECARAASIWRRIVEFAKQEANLQPPDSSLHLVKASFALHKLAAFANNKLKLAALVFDSSKQAFAPGMRGSAAIARQLLYKSGTVCIDLHVEPKPGSESVVVVGQLLDSMKPTHGMSGIPVALLHKGSSVSSKKTNDFGEFDFGSETPSDMHLAFGLEKGTTLLVPVPDLTPSGTWPGGLAAGND